MVFPVAATSKSSYASRLDNLSTDGMVFRRVHGAERSCRGTARVHQRLRDGRENLLKGTGRGIFLVRSFIDDVRLQRAPEGAWEIRTTKRLRPKAAADDSAKS